MSDRLEKQYEITRSCPKSPVLMRLGEWCDIAGHWCVKQHSLRQRQLAETVLIYCVSGKGWLQLESQKYDIKEGDLFYCPPHIKHGYGCDPKVGWEIWWVHAVGRHVDEFCRELKLTKDHPVINIGYSTKVVSCFSKLIDNLAEMNTKTAWKAAGSLHLLLLSIVECFEFRNIKNNDFLDLIDEHCNSLEELAQKAGYSKYHFCRLFKAQTGRSPWDVVLERKIERAKELLLGSRLTIKEIALELGFNHPDYFSRLFARFTGTLPKKYRGQYQL